MGCGNGREEEAITACRRSQGGGEDRRIPFRLAAAFLAASPGRRGSRLHREAQGGGEASPYLAAASSGRRREDAA